MWHLKTKTLPVVVGALVMVGKADPNYVSQILETLFNRSLKNNSLGHNTYPVEVTINVFFPNTNYIPYTSIKTFSYMRFHGET